MDKKKILYERALITCLLMLAVCVILKLFGADWFDLDTGIPILQKGNELYNNNVVFAFCATFTLKMLNTYLVMIVMLKSAKMNVKCTVSTTIFILISILFAYYKLNSAIIFIYEFTMPIIIAKLTSGIKIKEGCIVMILNMIYQIISFYIKSMGISLEFYGFVENNVYLIDYNIMLIITYLYLKRGGVELCSVIFHFCSYLRKKLCTEHLTKLKQSSADKGVKVDE